MGVWGGEGLGGRWVGGPWAEGRWVEGWWVTLVSAQIEGFVGADIPSNMKKIQEQRLHSLAGYLTTRPIVLPLRTKPSLFPSWPILRDEAFNSPPRTYAVVSCTNAVDFRLSLPSHQAAIESLW